MGHLVIQIAHPCVWDVIDPLKSRVFSTYSIMSNSCRSLLPVDPRLHQVVCISIYRPLQLFPFVFVLEPFSRHVIKIHDTLLIGSRGENQMSPLEMETRIGRLI